MVGAANDGLRRVSIAGGACSIPVEEVAGERDAVSVATEAVVY